MRKFARYLLFAALIFACNIPASAVEVLDFDISYHRLLNTDIVKNPDAPKIEEIIRYWADAIYETTNGNVLLGTVKIFQGSSNFISSYRLSDIVWSEAGHPKAAYGAYNSYDAQLPLGFRMAMFDKFNEYQTRNTVLDFLADENQVYAGYALASLSSHYIFDLREEYAVERGGKKFDALGSPSILNDVSKAAYDGDLKALNYSSLYKDNPKTSQKARWNMSAWEHIAKKYNFPKDLVPTKEDYKFILKETGKHFRDAQRHLKIVWVSSPVFQIVIDKSGSMAGDRERKAKNAAKDFVDSLQSGVRVGIVSFNDQAVLESPIVKITSGGNEKKELYNIIDKISIDGGTAIYDAAALAAAEMAKDSASIYEGRYVVLFTDGEDNRSKIKVDTLIKNLRDEKTSVLVMGLEEGVREETLRRIAAGTKGYYIMTANPLDTQEMLYSYLNNSFETQIDTSDAILQKGGAMQTVFNVENGIESLRITLISDGELNPKDFSFSVTPPKGKSEKPLLKSNAGKIEVVQNKPAAGRWAVSVTNKSNKNKRVRVTAFAKSSEIFLGNVLPVRGKSPNSVIIYASLMGGVTPHTDISINATLESPSGKTTRLEFQDMGYGADAAAGDGVYSAQADNCLEAGNYKVIVKFVNPGTGVETNRRYALLNPPGRGANEVYVIEDKGHTMPRLERLGIATFKIEGGKVTDSKEAMKEEKQIDYAKLKHFIDLARDMQKNRASSSEVARYVRLALRIDPDNAEAYRILGEAYDGANRYPEAVKAYTEAVRLEPNEPTHYYKLGQSFVYMKNLKKARETLETMQKKFPGNKWTDQLNVAVTHAKGS